ncbi:Satratoxin biosynthesis SC1 cluster protein 4 [Metarhizium anisopliae]|nr:Satratoxin biosynthesis SC1 cluster protein 4 [Metarhizium anisopliae]
MASLVPNVWAAIVIPVPASVLAVILRLKARRMTRMGMGRDDCFAVAALIFALGYTAVLIVWATCFKLGQPIGSYSQDLVDYYTEKSTLILWTSEFLYSWAIFCAKIAVLCFFLRVFRFASIRIPIMILITLCSIWITIRTFFTLLRCRPIQAFWVQDMPDATCFTNVRAYYLATDVTHSSMDFIILALPIYEVSRMKLPFGQKIAVVGLFATGSLVGIASIFQIVESQNYDPHELPYDLALCMVWGGVELHLAVFVGSLILLRPIFIKFVPGLASLSASKAASRPTRSSNAFQPGESSRRPSSLPDDAELGMEAVDATMTIGRGSSLALKEHSSSLTPICIHHEECDAETLPVQDDSGHSQSTAV